MKLSVIIPVYNTGERLRNTIESIVHQKSIDWELLLINDGSTDDITVSICNEYEKKYDMIRVVHQANQGLCEARNAGLSLSQGDYVTFCDHDDEFCADVMQKVLCFAEMNNLDVVKYDYAFICLDHGPRFPFKQDVFFRDSHVMNITDFAERYSVFYECGKLNFVWDGIYRKSFLQEHKILFNDRFQHGQEDVDFCIQICCALNRIGYYNSTCYIHYRYQTSTSRGLSSDKTRQVISDFIFVFQKQIDLFEKLQRHGLADTYWQTIELRNLLSLLAIVIKRDFSVSFREKAKYIIALRQCFPSYNRVVENTYGWSIKEKICYLLCFQSPYILIILSSLYARWLTYCVMKDE